MKVARLVSFCIVLACCLAPEGQAQDATCSAYGMFEADARDKCQSACDRECLKKQLCGGKPCPWPGYCWKCEGTPRHHATPDPRHTPTPAPHQCGCRQLAPRLDLDLSHFSGERDWSVVLRADWGHCGDGSGDQAVVRVITVGVGRHQEVPVARGGRASFLFLRRQHTYDVMFELEVRRPTLGTVRSPEQLRCRARRSVTIRGLGM